jgi:hypothetical protein
MNIDPKIRASLPSKATDENAANKYTSESIKNAVAKAKPVTKAISLWLLVFKRKNKSVAPAPTKMTK